FLPSALVAGLCCLALLGPGWAQGSRGKKYALLVGVKEYHHRGLADLKYTENDVAELAKILRPAGYAVTLLCDSEGQKDRSRKPTRANVEKALKEVLKGLGKHDTVLIAFAGHGLQFGKKGGAYFCPYDASPSDPKTLVSLNKQTVFTHDSA